jgi:hypothetical protein
MTRERNVWDAESLHEAQSYPFVASIALNAAFMSPPHHRPLLREIVLLSSPIAYINKATTQLGIGWKMCEGAQSLQMLWHI